MSDAAASRTDFSSLLGPALIALFGGAAIMAVEIVATRLVAQYLGASLYTWTAAIGVVLGGIMIGNYLGGRLADWGNSRGVLSGVLLCASLACLALPGWNVMIKDWEFTWTLSIPQRIALHVFLTFIVPTLILGMISPLVAKLAIDATGPDHPGRALGTMAACGAIGSIAGTFLAGFLLVAWIGSTQTLCLVAAISALAGLWLGGGWSASYLCSGASLAALVIAVTPGETCARLSQVLALRPFPSPYTIYMDESAYSFIAVERVQRDVTEAGQEVNVLRLDQLAHSYGRPETPDFLGYVYERIYAAVTEQARPADRPTHALMIGGGGYSYPRYYLHRWPDATMDAVEIDPAVTRAAELYFGLDRNDPRLSIHHADGRAFLRNELKRVRGGSTVRPYDFVYGDAVNDYTVPHHLTTVEFNRMVAEALSPSGVYLINLIDMYGTQSFLGAVVNSLREVFPTVYVFCASPTAPKPGERYTFVVLGAKQPLELGEIGREPPGPQRQFHRMSEEEIAPRMDRRRIFLTDDYAPVQSLLAEVVRESKRNVLAFVDRGVEYLRDNDPTTAERYFEKALKLDPKNPVALRFLSAAVRTQNRLEAAVTLQRKLVDENPTDPTAWLALGKTYMSLNRWDEALIALERAALLQPKSAEIQARLGETYLMHDRLDEAANCLRRAIAFYAPRPEYALQAADGLYNLARIARAAGRTDEMVQRLQAAIASSPEHADAQFELARIAHDAGRTDEARTHYEAAVAAQPEFAEAHSALAILLLDQDDAATAERHFRAAAALQPDNADAHLRLAQLLAKRRADAEAAAHFDAALNAKPDFADARYSFANFLYERGWLDAAAKHYRAVISAQPNYVNAYVNLGLLEQSRHRPADAIKTLDEGLAACEADAAIKRPLAWLLATCSDESLRDGARALTLARELAPDVETADIATLHVLAAALAQAGRFDEAINTAERGRTRAETEGNTQLAAELERCIGLYRQNKTYTAPGTTTRAADEPK